MSNRRPSPELVAALKFEIKRRYARKSKVGKRTRSMAAIRLAELTRWLHDTHGAGVELEPSDESLRLLKLFAHHMAALPEMPRRVKAWIDRYTPWLSLASQEVLIAEVAECPIKWSADRLAWKIGLKDEQRLRLKIRTIGAVDCTKEQRQERRKREHAERQKRLRATKRAQHID